MSGDDSDTILHATTIAFDGKAVVIIGPAGSGKSGLALQLMAMGAALIADDQTVLRAHGADIIAQSHPNLTGLIEARGIGILNARPADPAPVALVIDLNTVEADRIPPPRIHALLGHNIACLHKCEHSSWPAAILQYLKAGRNDA